MHMVNVNSVQTINSGIPHFKKQCPICKLLKGVPKDDDLPAQESLETIMEDVDFDN